MHNTVNKAVGIVCFNKDDKNKVVVVRHKESATHLTGIIGLPSGRPNPGEEDIDAAARELKEETGLETSKEFLKDLSYPFDPVDIKRKDGTQKWIWHLFYCQKYSGELKSEEETEPFWIDIQKLEKLDNLLPNTLEALKKVKLLLTKKSKISLIVAADEKNGIGKNGVMPWRIPADLQRFKELTLNHVLIMGRKTFDSIPGPLANRINIIITRDKEYKNLKAIVTHSLEEAVRIGEKEDKKGEIFIIGGGE
ncbi:MAG: dihydrofolate reductase, partial [Actinobacteria bacterium]|nr:dihydrofolate reductase [Actinomycetota bacterium]